MQFTGHAAAHGASVQCMHAIDTERSPGLPSLIVTTRRRLTPHGTSFSFLQAVTQALHSMQRSASQRNFIRATTISLCRSHLAERRFWFLHAGYWIVAIVRNHVCAFTEHDRVGAGRIVCAQVLAVEPTAKMVRHPHHAFGYALSDQSLDLGFGIRRVARPMVSAH